MNTVHIDIAPVPAPSERPKPGRLSGSDGRYDAYRLARDGDAAAGLRSMLVSTQELRANELHYVLVTLSRSFDEAARRLEAGDRRYVLTPSSQHDDLPRMLALLDAASAAVEEADRVMVYTDPSAEARARTLEAAATTLDAEVERMGLDGEHPQSGALREQATAIREAEAERGARVAAERRQAEHSKKAARIRRPLGKLEQKYLVALRDGTYITAVTRTEKAAVTSLVERGLIDEKPREDVSVRSSILRDAYVLTKAGATRAAELTR